MSNVLIKAFKDILNIGATDLEINLKYHCYGYGGFNTRDIYQTVTGSLPSSNRFAGKPAMVQQQIRSIMRSFVCIYPLSIYNIDVVGSKHTYRLINETVAIKL